jgi:hypothetical protein
MGHEWLTAPTSTIFLGMVQKLFTCAGGSIFSPDPALVLVSRLDGGNLIVTPPRDVWDRTELSATELTLWSFLIAATAKAMLDTLPQLEGGCINYWDAGNWALNERADPPGLKTGRIHRRVHMHLLGRSPTAKDPSWRWGEAPKFPDFTDRKVWAAKNQRLTAPECDAIVAKAKTILIEKYEFRENDL